MRNAIAQRLFAVAVGVATVGALCAIPTGAAATAVSSPWSQTDGNSGQGRANLTEKTLSPTAVARAKLLRHLATSTADPYCGSLVSSPVLAGGNVYDVANGQVTRYTAKTGKIGWRVTASPTGDPVYLQALAVSGGLVVAAENDCISQSDPDGLLVAFRATTGARVWATLANRPIDALVQSGAFLVASGSSASDGENTQVFRVSTGALLWTRDEEAACGRGAIVVHSLVIFGYCDPTTYAPILEADSLAAGHRLWNRPGFTPLRGTDSTGNGRIYAKGPDGKVDDLNAAIGVTRFALPGVTNVLAIDATRAYGNCGTQVCSVSQATGQQLWHVSDRSTLAAAADGVLYLSDGKVLKAATGQQITRLWTIPATALAIGDGRIAVIKPPPNNPASATVQLYGLAGF